MATAVATTFSTKRRFSSKMQMGAAAVALASAAAFTPAVIDSSAAHAAPAQIAFITKGVPYVVSAATAHRAAAPAAPSRTAAPSGITAQSLSDCQPTDLGCYLVEGIKTAGQQISQGPAYWTKGVVTFVGTAAYVTTAATGQVFKAIGLTRIGEVFTFVANRIASITQVGPYYS